MSNDINTRANIPRIELKAATPALIEKVRTASTQQAPREVIAEKAPDSKALRQQLKEATEQLNHQMQRNQSDLSFSVDDAANKVVVTVKNTKSGEVIRQIPSEAALKVAHNLANFKGLLEDKKI